MCFLGNLIDGQAALQDSRIIPENRAKIICRQFFIIMLALFSFRLFPLESFLHFKGKIMVIIIIPAVVLFVGHCGVCVYALLAAFIFRGEV